MSDENFKDHPEVVAVAVLSTGGWGAAGAAPENFKDHPQSIGERRSEDAGNGALWTPREAMIHVLRLIDSGEIKPEALVVCWSESDDKPGVKTTKFRASAPDPVTSVGLLTMIAQKMVGVA